MQGWSNWRSACSRQSRTFSATGDEPWQPRAYSLIARMCYLSMLDCTACVKYKVSEFMVVLIVCGPVIELCSGLSFLASLFLLLPVLTLQKCCTQGLS